MQRTCILLAGGPSRRSGQAVLRSTSVLASLLRMRSQFQRLRTSQQQVILSSMCGSRGEGSSSGSGATGDKVRGVDQGGTDNLISRLSSSTGLLKGSSRGTVDENTEEVATSDNLRSSASSSWYRAGTVLCTEAQHLLNKSARREDMLSDVPNDSPAYMAELGKLLSVASVFGASTTFPRVADVLVWIEHHLGDLQTPRQVMSLCMPILNLSDGSTKGVEYVQRVLFTPLLQSLEVAILPATSPPTQKNNKGGEAASSVPVVASAAHYTHLMTAATSVCTLVCRVAAAENNHELNHGSDDSSAQVAAKESQRTGDQSLLCLLEATCTLLVNLGLGELDSTSHSLSSPTSSLDATHGISLADCVQWLTAVHALEVAGGCCIESSSPPTPAYPSSDSTSKCLTDSILQLSDWQRRVMACYRQLFPLVRLTLAHCGPTAKTSELTEIVQLGLRMDTGNPNTALLLEQGIHLLPAAIASATVKDIVTMAQVVNRARLRRSTALSPQSLRQVSDALRPRLFQLRESHAQYLRHVDCSMLLSQLSWWEEMEGLRIADDVIELLSSRFAEQISVVEANHLVPFLQALVRIEERRRRRPGRASDVTMGDSVPPLVDGMHRRSGRAYLLYEVRCMERVLTQCVVHASSLARDEGRLQSTVAAHILKCLSQLSFPDCVAFFTAVRPLLEKQIAREGDSSREALEEEGETRLRVHEYVALQDALSCFVDYLSTHAASPLPSSSLPSLPQLMPPSMETEFARQAAEVLQRQLSEGSVRAVMQARTPKELVMAYPMVSAHHTASTGLTAEEGRNLYSASEGASNRIRGTAAAAASQQTSQRHNPSTPVLFVQQVCSLSPVSNIFELGALATAVSTFFTQRSVSEAAAHQAMAALWQRCADCLSDGTNVVQGRPLSLGDAKKLLDASRVTHFAGREAIPVSFLAALAAHCLSLTAETEGRGDGSANGGSRAAAMQGRGEALDPLHRIAMFGRTLVTYLSQPAIRSLCQSDPARLAACGQLMEAYLNIIHHKVELYAAEAAAALASKNAATACMGPMASFPMEQLSTVAHAVAQVESLGNTLFASLQEMGARGGVVADQFSSSEDPRSMAVMTGGDVANFGDSDALEGWGPIRECEADRDDEAPAVAVMGPLSPYASDILQLLGDTVAALLQNHQEREQDYLDCGDVQLRVESPRRHPKHLLALLQAFETANVRHQAMLYSLLPELRACAGSLDPLELSLLLNALMRLGVWNSRLMRHIAANVDEKMSTCGLRQCHSLLRGMQRSSSIDAQMFFDPRGTMRSDWDDAQLSTSGTGRSPIAQLADRAIHRLDHLVQSRRALNDVWQSNSLDDLVSVVTALRFFHSPPQPTYDAYVVASVKKVVALASELRQQHGQSGYSSFNHIEATPQSLKREIGGDAGATLCRSILTSATVLLRLVHHLRRSDHRLVSSRTLWTVIADVLQSPPGQAAASSLSPAKLCELLRGFATHSLLYDTAASAFTTSGATRFVESCLQDQLVSRWQTDGFLMPHERASLRSYAQNVLSPCVSASTLPAATFWPTHLPVNIAEMVGTSLPLQETHSSTLSRSELALVKTQVSAASSLTRAVWWSSCRDAKVDLLLLPPLAKVLNPALRCVAEDSPHLLSVGELVEVLISSAVLARAQDKGVSSFGDGSNEHRRTCYSMLRTLQSSRVSFSTQSAVDLWVALLPLIDTTPNFPASASASSTVASLVLSPAERVECLLFLRSVGEALNAQIMKPDKQGVRALLYLYRLLCADDGVFVQWTVQMAQLRHFQLLMPHFKHDKMGVPYGSVAEKDSLERVVEVALDLLQRSLAAVVDATNASARTCDSSTLSLPYRQKVVAVVQSCRVAYQGSEERLQGIFALTDQLKEFNS